MVNGLWANHYVNHLNDVHIFATYRPTLHPLRPSSWTCATG